MLWLEAGNFRAAVFWALDSPDPDDGELALRIAAQLSGVVNAGMRRGTGIAPAAERLLELAESSRPQFRRVILAGMASDALFIEGDATRAAALARRALADAGPTPYANSLGHLGMPHLVLAYCELTRGDFEHARSIATERREADAAAGLPAHLAALWLTLAAAD